MGFIVTMTLLAICAVAVVWVIGLSLMNARGNSQGPMRRAERYELKSARVTLDSIARLAAEYRTLDSSDLPYKISDLIAIHEKDTK